MSFLLKDTEAGWAQDDTLVFRAVNNPRLQQYDIRKITAAKNGKLWLSTGNGLVSYDGNDVQSFTHDTQDTNSLSGHSLSRTFMDKKGNLYAVIIADGQIDYFNTITGKALRHTIKIEREDSSGYSLAYPFQDISIDNDSIIWAGRTNMGFIRYNVKSGEARSYSLLSSSNTRLNTVYAIRKDPGNDWILWLATNNGIYSFNKKNNQLKRNFVCSQMGDSTEADTDLRGLDAGNKDTLWFTSLQRGIGCYEISTGRYTIFPYSMHGEEEKLFAMNLQYLRNKQYLVTLGKRSPWIFNTITRQYNVHSRITPQLPAIETYQALADSLGNIWGLFHGRLYLARQNRNEFTSVAVRDQHYKDRTFNTFKTVIWDARAGLYYAAFHMSDGIFAFDRNMQYVKTILAPPYKHPSFGTLEAFVVDIGLDRNGRLWMCGDAIHIYDSVQQKMVPAASLYPGLKMLNQRFRNLVFRKNLLYLLPQNISSAYVYRVDTDRYLCDSVFISGLPLGEQKNPEQLGPLEMDSMGQVLYLSNKNIVYQYHLLKNKTRKVIEVTDIDKPYAHRPNFHWYNVDDNDNLWISSLSNTWIFEPVNLTISRWFRRKTLTYFNQAYHINGRGIMAYVNSTSYDLYDYKKEKQYRLSIGDGLITYINYGTAFANNLLFVGGFNYLQYIPFSAVTHEKERRSYLTNIQLFNHPFKLDSIPEHLHSLRLPYNKNFITLTFSSTEFEQPELLEYRYQLRGVDKDWVYTSYLNRTISYPNLKPGEYTFLSSVMNDDGSWNDTEHPLLITIVPAFWQTDLFKIALATAVLLLAFILIRRRINMVRKQEQQKARIEREIFELEAKALRAQMNPHFIFNSLNSIKSLIQQDKDQKAITYLTTFSKLIRTLFNNADKKEISLFDELETCMLYLQLESMRFEEKFNYEIKIDGTIDTKSVMVPALVIQPFIENAIWHGIVPRGFGHIELVIQNRLDAIEVIIDDDGIGREASRLNGSQTGLAHQSKGIRLTQSRLQLNHLITQRKANLQIIDKKSEKAVTGTRVILSFDNQLS